MAAVDNKFDGDVFGVISLVDSRHDFKGTSQDTGIKIGDDGMDCFQNFTNNIQREILGLPPGYSKRLTSTCKGGQVMRRDPEDEFLQFVETNCGIPFTPGNLAAIPAAGAEIQRPDNLVSPGWNGIGGAAAAVGPNGQNFRKYAVRASHFGLTVIDTNAGAAAAARNYADYHRTIATLLGYEEGGNPIPVVVDTTRTLTHDSSPFFIICRNKECIADPSNTSSMLFPLIALELDSNAPRQYLINNVNHSVEGTIDSPVIGYNIAVPGEAAGPVDAVYAFGAAAGRRKPNEIEVCKGKIKEVVSSIINAGPGGAQLPLANYQTIVVPAGVGAVIRRLIGLFSANCGIYNNLVYINPPVTTPIKKEIAIPYIAKRGGDQLQVESCLKQISYRQMRLIQGPPGPRGGAGEYSYVPINGAPNQNITNAIFWTIDRVAACYAILKGVTTVLQLPTKDVIIYKKMDYAPGWAGGKHKKIRGGAVCTKGQLQAAFQGAYKVHRNITDDCFLRMYEELCLPFGTHYDPFTLLNLLYYSQLIDIIPGRSLLNIYKKNNLQLNLSRCIIQVNDIGEANAGYMYPQNIIDMKYILFVPEIPVIKARADRTIKIDGIQQAISSNNLVISLYANSGASSDMAMRQLKIAYYIGRFDLNIPLAEINEFEGGGKKNNIYDDWFELQTNFNFEKGLKLFIDFIELFAIAENQYFLHRDSADNFYVYNPNSQVTHGGHSQIEMMVFLESLITTFKKYRELKNRLKLENFLKTFIHFPFILKSLGFEIILNQIFEYLNVWFEYTNITNELINDLSQFNKDISIIFKNASIKSKKIQEKLSINSEECANYLHTIFPHGYFVIQYKSLLSKNNNNYNKIIQKFSNIYINTKKRNNNINNIISRVKGLSIKNKSYQMRNKSRRGISKLTPRLTSNLPTTGGKNKYIKRKTMKK